MCGICGYYSKKQEEKRELLKKMGKAIEHRGPNDVGYFFEGGLGLCHRRLSILDLSERGHQPMETLERYVIVFNGEIYNYIELRIELEENGYVFHTGTDTEIIPAAFDLWGESCVNHFNGMWAFCLWDEQKKTLFCARDRFGVKPFYYYMDENRFVFASEIKAILCDDTINRVANEPIIYDYLTQGLVEHTDETFFKDIFKLPPGCFMTIGSQMDIEIKQYYDVQFSNLTKGRLEQKDIEEFKKLFTDSVNVRLRADVPIGSCLSGGLDSSSIVCCMDELLQKEEKNTEQHTFSFCTEDKRIDERRYMEAVTKQTNTIPHQIFSSETDMKKELRELIYYQDEPFSSTGMYASYCVYRAARQSGITVLLDGQGADEILCGYRKSRVYYVKKLLNEKHYLKAFREFCGSISQVKSSMFLKNDILKLKKILSKGDSGSTEGYLKKDFCEKESGYDYSRKEDFQHNDVYVVSLPALLRYADRNSMAFSVESRLPFLDYRLVEFCASLPLEKKIHGGWSKYIMRKSLKMPEVIKNRKDKIGFATPEDIWLKKERNSFREIFKAEEIRSAKFVDVDKLLQEWDKILDENNASGLFRYICLELWMREFQVRAE